MWRASASAEPPAATIASTTVRQSSTLRLETITCAPCAAVKQQPDEMAADSPIPRLAPGDDGNLAGQVRKCWGCHVSAPVILKCQHLEHLETTEHQSWWPYISRWDPTGFLCVCSGVPRCSLWFKVFSNSTIGNQLPRPPGFWRTSASLFATSRNASSQIVDPADAQPVRVV